jgi:hypothetical protein
LTVARHSSSGEERRAVDLVGSRLSWYLDTSINVSFESALWSRKRVFTVREVVDEEIL